MSDGDDQAADAQGSAKPFRSRIDPVRPASWWAERDIKDRVLKAREQKLQLAYLIVGAALILLLLQATTRYKFMHAFGGMALRGDNWTGEVALCGSRGCRTGPSTQAETVATTVPFADATAASQ